MGNLVALDMSYSNIESFDMSYNNPERPVKRQKVTGSWSKEKRMLVSLKFLTLSFCEKLVNIGGFLELPTLERLIATHCLRLTEICESIKQCVELDHIDLSYCKMLEKLPTSIGRLKVKTLLLHGCHISELPIKDADIGITLEAVANNLKLFAISLPSSLVRLSLAYNNLSNESFPMDFSCLSMLKDLRLDGNPIVSLPSCVRTLPRIETLGMSNCLKLMSLEHPPCTLRELDLYYNSRTPTPTHSKVLLRKILFDPEMGPLKLIADRNLLAPSSFEIDGIIKIQPMAAIHEKLLSSLEWPDLKFLNEERLMVTNKNYAGPEESEIQMYYEFGIFSTIYTGIELPKSEIDLLRQMGQSISFNVPSSPCKLIRGLNICIVGQLFELPVIKISNITQNRTWMYSHYIQSISGGMYSAFLSHWMFGMNEMEAGDKITISLDKHGDLAYVDWTCLVYDDRSVEEDDVLGYYKSWNHIIGGDLSAFQLTTGEYFLNSTEILRTLFSNAHYKERTFSFRAFSPRKSDILGHPREVHVFDDSKLENLDCTVTSSPNFHRLLGFKDQYLDLDLDMDMDLYHYMSSH